MIRRRDFGRWIAMASLLALTGGCGVYSVNSGRVDESIRMVAVPYLENYSDQPGIEVEITELIIQAVQNDNILKVVDEKNADTVISGKVLGYRQRESFTGSDLTVNEYKVQIVVEMTMAVVATGENLIERKRITGTGNYILDDPAGSTESTARKEAVNQIVRDIQALVVEDW